MKKKQKPKKEIEDWQRDDAARLKRLFEDKSINLLSQAEFGAEYDIGNQSMVGQYLNGLRPLNLSAAGKFANGLNCTIDKFSPRLAAQIRELAGFVEDGCKTARTAR